MELTYKIHSRILLLAMIGVIMACCSYLTFVYDPLAIIIRKLLALAPNSILYMLWIDPPYGVYIKTYIFNITNHEKFLTGEEKLNVVELGPYVYKEILQNTNSRFNENGTVTFEPHRRLEFIPELSVGDPKDHFITCLNIPLVGITAALEDSSMATNIAVATITQYIGSKPFMNISIHDFLWGYDDPLVALANKVIPNWIDFPKFGILERMMSLDNASNVITINVNPGDHLSNNPLLTKEEKSLPYTIQNWNGSPGLTNWGYIEPEGNETIPTNTKCNMVEGAFEGGIYPMASIKENATIRMYRRAFCRPVTFKYEALETTKDGFEGTRFRVAGDFLARPEVNPENDCYCVDGKCQPNGITLLSPCYYGIPVSISQPHFYNADPSIQDQVTGMSPNVEEHDSVLVLHNKMGIPLRAKMGIQINLVVGETKYNYKTKPFNNKVIPLFWVALNIDSVPTSVGILLRLVYDVLPVMEVVLMYLLGIVGLCLISGSALVIVLGPRSNPIDAFTLRRDYKPIPILPMNSPYFRPDVRISK